MATPKKKREDWGPVGTPPKFKKKYLNLLMQHFSEGKSYESFAGRIRVTRMTLYNWEKQYPEFLYTKQVGLELYNYNCECLNVDVSRGQEVSSYDEKPLNVRNIPPAILKLNMVNRFKWSDSLSELERIRNEVEKLKEDNQKFIQLKYSTEKTNEEK